MTLNEAILRFGPGSEDGMLIKLIDAGFTCFSSHEGGRGWKLIGERVAFVDSWGGAWGLPEGSEQSWADYCQQARQAGAVSMNDVLDAAARASS